MSIRPYYFVIACLGAFFVAGCGESGNAVVEPTGLTEEQQAEQEQMEKEREDTKDSRVPSR